VLGVNNAHLFRSWGKRPTVADTAADIARTRRSSDWKRLSAGAGTKGPRLHDWCYLELADLEAEEANSTNHSLWTRGLLIRRHIADGDLAFFTTWFPAGTSIETLVDVEGHRWAIGQFRDREKRIRARSQREQILAWVASSRFPGDARLRHDGGDPPSRQFAAAKKTKRRTTAKLKISPIRH
jgi:SRSO17 transposase